MIYSAIDCSAVESNEPRPADSEMNLESASESAQNSNNFDGVRTSAISILGITPTVLLKNTTGLDGTDRSPLSTQMLNFSNNVTGVEHFETYLTEINTLSNDLVLESTKQKIIHLVQKLEHGSDATQCSAAKYLWYWYRKEPVYLTIVAASGAIPHLVHLLSVGSDRTKRAAAGTLRSLTSDAERRVAITAAGAVPPLVQLLSDGIQDAKRQAAGALEALSKDPGSEIPMAAMGAIPPLVLLLSDNTADERTKELAVGALRNLAFDADNERVIGAVGAIPLIVHMLRVGTPFGQRQAVSALVNLSVNFENKRIIAAEGAIPLLVNLLAGEGNCEIATRAAGALKNLSAYSAENREAIAAAGAIPLLAKLLLALPGDGCEHAKEQALGSLRNLAFRAQCAREMVTEGVVSLLLANLRDPNRVADRHAMGTLWCLGSHIDMSVALSEIDADTIGAMLAALSSCDEGIGNTAVGLLSIVPTVTAVDIAEAGGRAPLERQLARDPAELLPTARDKLLQLKECMDAAMNPGFCAAK